MVFGTVTKQQSVGSYDIYTGVYVEKNEPKRENTALSLEELVKRQQERLLGKRIEKPVKRSTIMPVK